MPPLEVIEAIQARPWKELISTIDIRNEVRPADLFCYLGARFGRPNGL
jgi:hypothetical protein